MKPAVARRLARRGRHFEPTWRYVFNLAPTLSYRRTRRPLVGEAARVVRDLNASGIAITSADKLPTTDSYEELALEVQALEEELADELKLDRIASTENDAIGQKTFMRELLGSKPELDPTSIYARFALQQPMLNVADAYFGMYTQLRYYNVWHTFPTQSPPRESQLWHRDREDYLVTKAFVYLSDVDEGAGPFTYAPGTHPKGTVRGEAGSFLEGNVARSSDEQMATIVRPEKWIQATGPAGTIIFADTRGYHKGGFVRERDRIMYTCLYTSQASQVTELFARPPNRSGAATRREAFALSRGPRTRGTH